MPYARGSDFNGHLSPDFTAGRNCHVAKQKSKGAIHGDRAMIEYKFRMSVLVLTPLNKKLFLRWALKGFKRRKSPTRRSENKEAAKIA